MAGMFDWPFDQPRLSDELLRAFAPFFSSGATRSAGVFPPVNIHDDGSSFLVRAEVPGMKKEDVEVTVKGDQLTLRGERIVHSPDAKASFHRRERDGGKFRRVVTLPEPVDVERISAKYENGVLEVVLPRVPQAQPKRVEIQ